MLEPKERKDDEQFAFKWGSEPGTSRVIVKCTYHVKTMDLDKFKLAGFTNMEKLVLIMNGTKIVGWKQK